MLTHVQLFVTLLWTVACQAPLSTEFSKQGYWSGLPFLPLGDLPHPGIEPNFLHWQVGSLLLSPLGSPFYVDGDHRCLGFIALTLIERRRQILLNSSFPFSNDHAFKDFEI